MASDFRGGSTRSFVVEIVRERNGCLVSTLIIRQLQNDFKKRLFVIEEVKGVSKPGVTVSLFKIVPERVLGR